MRKLKIGFQFIDVVGLGKLPAIPVIASTFFFRHRLLCTTSLLLVPMLIVTLGIALFFERAGLQVACLFISCFFQTWVYGALMTFAEGRQRTETLLALTMAMYIYAGSLARGTASLVLRWGVGARLMPLVIGTSACFVACVLLRYVAKLPGPSAADVRARSKRSSMSSRRRWQLVRAWGWGLPSVIGAYAVSKQNKAS